MDAHIIHVFKMDYKTIFFKQKFDCLMWKHGWLNSCLVSDDNPCQGLQAWWHKLHQTLSKVLQSL
jgi:hypothetical protein